MARRRSAARPGVTGLGLREELAPGVFINSFYRGCTPGFVYTEEGIILIGAPLIQSRHWTGAQIEDEYPGELFLYLINTDHHRGHAGQPVLHARNGHRPGGAHKEMSGYTENFKSACVTASSASRRSGAAQQHRDHPAPHHLHQPRHHALRRSQDRVDLRRRPHAGLPASSGCPKRASASWATSSGWTNIPTWRRATPSNGSMPWR